MSLDDMALTEGIEGPWHEVAVYVDTFMDDDGDERPGWNFDGPHCTEACDEPGDCLLVTTFWPPEGHEVPHPGHYLVRVNTAAWIGDLEWQER